MNNISHGSRGPAVEDIQRRLNYLGYAIGSSGVDGVFLEDTAEAVRLFQASIGLSPDGVVDSETWSQLVDSTFRFGDRLLYLRYPLFHGRDVEILQTALNSLGFMTGEIDGIFGPSTEAAVSDFQNNISIQADGVCGFSTYEALQGMKHMWEGREIISHSEARKKTLNRREALKDIALKFIVWSPVDLRIARRIQNLAHASFENAEVSILNLYSQQQQIPLGTDGYSPQGRPIIEVALQLDVRALYTEPAEEDADALKSDLEQHTEGPLPTLSTIVELNFEKNVFISQLKSALSGFSPASIVLRSEEGSGPLTSNYSAQELAVYILDSICESV